MPRMDHQIFIYVSNYENGSLRGELHAERYCQFNEKGTRWVHERISAVDNKNMVMHNTVIEAGKFPVDQDNSQGIYAVRDNGDGTATASVEFQYRTKPAFMGSLVKGQFKRLLQGTLIGLKHYVETDEKVNAVNGKFKEIKDRYEKPKVVKTR